MWRILRDRLRPLPPGPALSDRFRGRPVVDATRCPDGCRACIDACPTGALSEDLKLDLGKCLFCSDCAQACPEGAVSYTADLALASTRREDLRGTPTVQALAKEMLRLFKRSLRLRQVSAGGCNGCEAEVLATSNVTFDLQRYGIQFVASPRHADGILVTGPVTGHMRAALTETYEAVAAPKLVIAVGACAISGGPYIGRPEVAGGAAEVVPVDLFVPGCPPHPLTIIDGLLGLLARR